MIPKISFEEGDVNLSIDPWVFDEPHVLARGVETQVHAAADKHAPAIKALFTEAFKHAAKRIPRTALVRSSSPTVVTLLLEPALQALGDSLEPGLEAALLACLADGGQAGLDLLGLRINSVQNTTDVIDPQALHINSAKNPDQKSDVTN